MVPGAGASATAHCTLLAAALLLVCWEGGGRGVDADPPAAAWHEDTQGLRDIPQGTGTMGEMFPVKQAFGEGHVSSAGGNTN